MELEPLEFIARLVQHIPDVRERQVLYYGVYANASKRLPRRRTKNGQGGEVDFLMPVEESTTFQRQQRIKWAQLIRRVWLEDPLLCPHCGGEMMTGSAPRLEVCPIGRQNLRQRLAFGREGGIITAVGHLASRNPGQDGGREL